MIKIKRIKLLLLKLCAKRDELTRRFFRSKLEWLTNTFLIDTHTD